MVSHGTRATGKVRRWIRHWGAAYMWTLTFRQPVYDYRELAQAVDQLLRRLREAALYRKGRSQKVVLILVPEPHPGGHGWHLHGATNVYIPHKKMAELWGEGYVFVTRQRNRGRSWAPRTLSRYLAKYLGKQLGDDELHGCSPRPAGAHRYWHTEDGVPAPLRQRFATLADALAWLGRHYGQWDHEAPFGDAGADPVFGYHLSFPDAVAARWKQRVQAVSRAQRGEP